MSNAWLHFALLATKDGKADQLDLMDPACNHFRNRF